MRVIIQRSSGGSCEVDGAVTGSIEHGLVALVGFTHEDTNDDISWMAEKIVNLRIFEDDAGKMNESLLDQGGKILSIPQFTLYGDCRKGRRPNFMQAAAPEEAQSLFQRFNGRLAEKGAEVETGRFGAEMNISLTNHGPVTFVLDSPS
ncbi:D-aminoacyl-tRNA deacylase [Salibacterium halotolerans]|uniref:D-aminoacyl-tRNA deacylase n=1 Tax=Salibacterium halotolerans TaxID=1884432 RepID=A0A1I5UDW3_9BACI|nr:D-aminoacyl-tRNA deacylase [Salibacterium halotolerans]SFP93452.1 D-tyrosyl-tRNA(Tyr) deacylase [Salibacterium halotolerans]